MNPKIVETSETTDVEEVCVCACVCVCVCARARECVSSETTDLEEVCVCVCVCVCPLRLKLKKKIRRLAFLSLACRQVTHVPLYSTHSKWSFFFLGSDIWRVLSFPCSTECGGRLAFFLFGRARCGASSGSR